MLSELDQAIAERLLDVRDYLAAEKAVLVRKLPNEAGRFGRSEDTEDEGDVYFVIRSGRCEPPAALNMGRYSQDENLIITLVVDLPERYTKYGCYDIWERCKALLLGFHPAQVISPIFLQKWDFVRDRYWVIEADFIAVTKTSFGYTDYVDPDPAENTVLTIGHKDVSTNEILAEVSK